MWKSKEFEDIWWCKNQINIRCQSGFGRGYNHCDRYVTVKAEKIQFLKRRIFQKKKKNFKLLNKGFTWDCEKWSSLLFDVLILWQRQCSVNCGTNFRPRVLILTQKEKYCMNFHFSVGSIRVCAEIKF